jgi:RNA polymerase sigma-70 factor, ECF subfamily
MYLDRVGSRLAIMLADEDDATLMRRYRDGDVSAFELLYGRHKAVLYRYLYRLCHGAELCNDVFQETWSKVIDARHQYTARAQFRTYLLSIAHNCAIDHLRRSNRLQAHELEDSAVIAETVADDHDRPDMLLSVAQLQNEFQHVLQSLPHQQREVFVLYEDAGLSLAEIAEVTGIPIETAKSRLRYAVKKLRESLRQYNPATPSTLPGLAPKAVI